jgi:hypothetical protein
MYAARGSLPSPSYSQHRFFVVRVTLLRYFGKTFLTVNIVAVTKAAKNVKIASFTSIKRSNSVTDVELL